MAIYHLNAKLVKRSDGRSAVAAAAYRAGVALEDERRGIVADYSRKHGVDETLILAPENAPYWVYDRGPLWNSIEAVEKRKDAQVAREIDVAIPRELPRDQKIDVVRSWVQTNCVDRGMVADIAWHDLDTQNPHAHIMLSLRTLDIDGWGKKQRDWNDRGVLQQWRETWEQSANLALERAGRDERIDHRTLEAQGIDREPQTHIGPAAAEMEQRGVETERGSVNRAIVELNIALDELERVRQVAELSNEDLERVIDNADQEREEHEDYVDYGRRLEIRAQGQVNYAQVRIDQWREAHRTRSLLHDWFGFGARELVNREANLQTAREDLQEATLDSERREREVDEIKASREYQDQQDLAAAADIERDRRYRERVRQADLEREKRREREREDDRGLER